MDITKCGAIELIHIDLRAEKTLTTLEAREGAGQDLLERLDALERVRVKALKHFSGPLGYVRHPLLPPGSGRDLWPAALLADVECALRAL